MLEANLVSTFCGQEGGNPWTGGKFTSAKFVQGLAISQDASTVLGLNDEGAKVLYSTCNRQGFDLTW